MTDARALRGAGRRELAQLAGKGNGIFTASAARAIGLSSSTLAYHSRTGSVERLGHGVYRIADYPSSPQEPLIAAAAALGKDAIVSHESALKLYGVSDVAPSRLHFTLPRARRYVTAPAADVELHTTTRPFAPGDVVQHEGFRATSLAQSIVDAARARTDPEQIAMAVREGMRRGLVTKRDLERAIQTAPARVRRLIEGGQSAYVEVMNDRVADATHLYQTNDHIALALGRLAAQRLSPDGIAAFRRFVQREQRLHHDNKYLRLWIDIINRGADALRQALTESTQRGQVLRSVISFRAFVSKAERDDIFRQYTRSSGVAR
jgi:predicted transcriptional regulator of viral defense system